ncbi:MAG TPA: hypothetical protein VMZ52_09085, partial [Bryobacteraceae bacterium]|nr:hypothetical protein [Bryobacteraceae bacterium]
YPTGGVKAAAAGVRRIRDDGTFTAMTSATLDGGTWRIRIRVNLEWTGGNKISVEGAIDYSPLECFLAVTDRHEQARPTSQSHFEFLSSVRKMFQPAKGSPLEPLFPLLLDRTKNVPRLAGLDTADGKNVRRFETIEIQGVPADMGHVLIGIEASRRQQPALHGFGLPIVWAGDDIEVSLTWIGDLGGVLAWVAQETPLAGSGPKPDLQRLLPLKASYEDLRGDLDGINLGTMYEETRSLAANLRSYYDATPFRRFRNFVVNARNAAGTPVFRLTGGNPPKIDRSARAAVAWYLQLFVHRFLIFPMNKRYAGMTDPQKIAALDIGRAGSVQSNAVIDYFFQFLDDGLAKEP